jgi:hypothetical protein
MKLNESIQLMLTGIITFTQYQMFIAYGTQMSNIQKQNDLLNAKLEAYLDKTMLLSHKIDHLDSALASHTVEVSSKTSFLECATFAGIILIVLFRPDNSDNTIEFMTSSFKKISDENGAIANRIEDVSRMCSESAKSSVLEQLPAVEAVQKLDTLLSQLYQ